MSEIVTLTGGAGKKTQKELNYVPQNILIDAIDTDVPIQGINVMVDGDPAIAITNQSRIQAFAKWLQGGLLGADVKVGMMLKIANGQVDLPAGSTCTMILENAGATTPKVYANSEGKGDDVFMVGEDAVIASTSKVFDDFDFLAFDPTNISYAVVTFADGHQQRMEIAELRALYSKYNTSDADGELAGLVCVDNDADDDGVRDIARFELQAGSGGNTTVLKVDM